jgi:DNA gyrase inhibitor GyrI
MAVKIVCFKKQKVATLAHYGDPKLHYQTSMKFIAWRKATK